MTSKQRRQVLALVALGVVLTAALAWQFGAGSGGPTPAQTAAANRQAAAAARTRKASGASATAVDPSALEIRLAKLGEVAPEPAEAARDPFRFRPAAAPPAPPLAAGRPGGASPGTPIAPPVAAPVEPSGPPAPPPPPPITLKFIGMLTQAATGRMAVLSDGKFVYHGREGDIIEGRYRVVKIGEESIQMEYVDGRGRQTIRLSGT